LYASQAEQANLDFAMTVPQRPLMVRGDASQLQRALANVLDNSLKFTSAPGQIVMTLEAQEDKAVITVRDSGIGIPAEDIPQLFGRFHRGRNTAGYVGSGLGLAIVQEIMARHRGRATVESGARGTTVRLTLPLQPSAA
jgi:signal transduction histidine kinase